MLDGNVTLSNAIHIFEKSEINLEKDHVLTPYTFRNISETADIMPLTRGLQRLRFYGRTTCSNKENKSSVIKCD